MMGQMDVNLVHIFKKDIYTVLIMLRRYTNLDSSVICYRWLKGLIGWQIDQKKASVKVEVLW